DLLASRGVHESPHAAPPAAATRSVELTLRGGRLEGVSSPESRRSVVIDDLRETARRLHSMLVVFHVGPSATFVWTIDPAGGKVHGAKIAVGGERLRELVTSARPQLAGVPRGDDRSPAPLA